MFYSRNRSSRTFDPAQRYRIALLIFMSNLLSQLSLDLYTPSFPAMQSAFSTSSTQIQLSLTVYVFGYGLWQMLFGYCADRWGRRPMLLVGQCGFLISSFALLYTHSIHAFLWWRFCQGSFGAAFSVAMRTSFRDLFSGTELVKVSGLFSAIWTLIPIIAPVLGGYIQIYGGWHTQFELLFCGSAFVLLITYRLLPETRPASAAAEERRFFAVVWSLCRGSPLLWWALAAASVSSLLIMFVTISPFLLQVNFALSPPQYGWFMLLVSAFYMLGAVVIGHFTTRFNSKHIFLRLLIALVVIALLFVLSSWLMPLPLWTILLPMSAIYLLTGVIYPMVSGRAYQYTQRYAGVCSAFYGTILVLFAALVSYITAHLPHHSTVPFSVLCLTVSVVTFCISIILLRRNTSGTAFI